MRASRQHRGAYLVLDFPRDFRILLQIGPRVVLALADTVAAIAVPRTRLLDDILLDADIYNLAFPRHALAIQDIEVRDLERRRQFVLHHLDAGFVADDLVPFLDGTNAADIEAHGRIKLQRVTAGRGLRIA